MLNEIYLIAPSNGIRADPNALAHWSIGDTPANKLSSSEDRTPPADAKIHESFNQRKEAAPVPVRWKGDIKDMDFPTQLQIKGSRKLVARVNELSGNPGSLKCRDQS